jgi:hypothetical protein
VGDPTVVGLVAEQAFELQGRFFGSFRELRFVFGYNS